LEQAIFGGEVALGKEEILFILGFDVVDAPAIPPHNDLFKNTGQRLLFGSATGPRKGHKEQNDFPRRSHEMRLMG
jgi:hypothetical protein